VSPERKAAFAASGCRSHEALHANTGTLTIELIDKKRVICYMDKFAIWSFQYRKQGDY